MTPRGSSPQSLSGKIVRDCIDLVTDFFGCCIETPVGDRRYMWSHDLLIADYDFCRDRYRQNNSLERPAAKYDLIRRWSRSKASIWRSRVVISS
jgi:hypothetical protein